MIAFVAVAVSLHLVHVLLYLIHVLGLCLPD